ncbi:unnamed protein product [Arctogadus glacialis]
MEHGLELNQECLITTFKEVYFVSERFEEAKKKTRVTGKLTCRVCDKVGLSRLDKHLADLHQLPPNDQLPLDSWLPPHPPLPPCLSIQWIALPLSSPVQCMTGDLSCTALEKRVEGLELAVRQLQATMSLQHDSSTATPQATSSAALASPSPGTTHSPDRETPSTPSMSTECPFCGKHMKHLRPHLTGYHQVRNVEETILLVSWSSGREFAKTIKRPFSVYYNPYTQSIDLLKDTRSIEDVVQDLRSDLTTVCDALGKMNTYLGIGARRCSAFCCPLSSFVCNDATHTASPTRSPEKGLA